MKQPVSRRHQPLKRTIIYGFMTITVTSIVAVLMLVVLGYSFDQQDGKLEQGGLLQFESIPNGATITLDELKLSARTATKRTVAAGSHSVLFDLDGYHSWRKTITITPGQVGWLNYARMIPLELTPQTVRTLPVVTSAVASPKRNFIMMNGAADQPVFELADIRGETVRHTTIVLPEDSYTAPGDNKQQTFTIDNWSRNENAVLVKHVYGKNAAEWLLLDRDEPEKSLNISAMFGINPKKLVFAGEGDRLLFVQTDDIVRRIDLNAQTLSRPLASGMAEFGEYDDETIIYTTIASANGSRTVGYSSMDGKEPQTIQAYPDGEQPLYAAMETYFGERYVAVVHGEKLVISTGILPASDAEVNLKQVAAIDVPPGARNPTISENGRFVVVELPDGYATYDIELKKYDRTKWAYKSGKQQSPRWLDDYIMWSDNSGQLRLYDFDGANQQNIMPVTEGLAAVVTPNDKYIYGFLKTDKGYELRRVQLVL